MGPQACRMLWTYWGWPRMAAMAGGYYGSDFQGFRGMNQGDLLSSTIFNVMVDAVTRHWFEVMAESAED